MDQFGIDHSPLNERRNNDRSLEDSQTITNARLTPERDIRNFYTEVVKRQVFVDAYDHGKVINADVTIFAVYGISRIKKVEIIVDHFDFTPVTTHKED
jgi:hypothetical protein